MEISNSLKSVDVIAQLKELDVKLKRKDAEIAWTSFPFSEDNLQVIRKTLKKVRNNDKYRLSYDENDIFIEKDCF